MKKICILTYHHTPNYGAVLQTKGLQTVLTNNGYETKILNYKNELIEKNFKKLRFYEFKNPINYFNYLRKFSKIKKRNEIFDYFVKNELNCTKLYSKANIALSEFEFDKFIVGSDQVWNYKITDFDTTYFLDFIQNNQKKISYAASFGFSKLDDITEQYLNQYAVMLNKFKYLSVRENSGKKIIKKLNDRNSIVVLDPVFLIKKTEWETIANIQEKQEDFIFVYELEKNDEMVNSAIRRANQEGKNIIILTQHIRKNIDCSIMYCEPYKFLEYVHNATNIYTNSFHGVSFSLIFEKQFIFFPLIRNKILNSRVYDLFEIINIQSSERNINYKNVKEKITSVRKQSLEFLINSIEDVK